jgi:hypothetical protein
MIAYRECLRHVWNAYLASNVDPESATTVFGRLQELLFEGLVSSQIAGWSSTKVILIVPYKSAPVLVRRESSDGNVYWDPMQAPSDDREAIQLAFVAYYDFFQEPSKDLRFYRCLISKFAANHQFENREALVDVADAEACFAGIPTEI